MNALARVAARWSLAAMLFGFVSEVQALVVPAGDDLFESVSGSPVSNGTWVDTPGPLPVGFFGIKNGTPSDPIPGGTRLFLNGHPAALPDPPGPYSTFAIPAPFNEIALLAQHGVFDNRNGSGLSGVDTIVQRQGAASLPFVGASDTIPIEIIALELKSVAPITVTFGAEPASFFDVFVDLQPIQNPGSMTLTRTSAYGGTFDSQLPVSYRVVFQNTNPLDDPQVAQTQGPIPGTDVFNSDDTPWTFHAVPEPSTQVLSLLGLASLAVLVWRQKRNT